MKHSSPSTLPTLNSTSEPSAEREFLLHGHQILLANLLWCATFTCALTVFSMILLFNQWNRIRVQLQLTLYVEIF